MAPSGAPGEDDDRSLSPLQAIRLARRMVDTGAVSDADRWTRHLVASRPLDPRVHNVRAMALQKLFHPAEAARAMRQAVVLHPQEGALWANLGKALRYARLAGSETAHRRALLIEPAHPCYRLDLGVDLLTQGDLPGGFALFDARPEVAAMRDWADRGAVEPWDDQPLAGRDLLLVTEQGIGDVVQFARYIPLLADAGARVTISSQGGVKRLIETVPGVANVVVGRQRGPMLAEMLMRLPVRFGTKLETIPWPGRYLNPPDHPYRLGDDGRLKVGLAWSGNPDHPRDHWRSLPPESLEPLADCPGVTLFSLQVGATSDSRPDLPDGLAGRVDDLAPRIADFADTAGLIDQLDLVVTVDSAVAHIAGALGKPVFVLLSYLSDWRWLEAREDSPWYPSARLFRQRTPGDWQEVVARVAEAVAALAGARRDRGFASPGEPG